jgi:hypothetical protein
LAVKRGILVARGEYRFMLDADLSMPVTEINRFLPPFLVDFDIAIACGAPAPSGWRACLPARGRQDLQHADPRAGRPRHPGHPVRIQMLSSGNREIYSGVRPCPAGPSTSFSTWPAAWVTALKRFHPLAIQSQQPHQRGAGPLRMALDIFRIRLNGLQGNMAGRFDPALLPASRT